ncbi:hypothetical protein F7734_08650 [Scytonema sp. UIC 10036]|uniref:hypothetical protein n=1 Tax=Scytonema sp. UIC 10036 TaxID=2304196 RepID=UPI0012DA031E|nr:hypothetical protein [Scytonema sp. UIC 10036]MUG92525.1 hypothetical protein [Scytonema sp. UIC 10036]
MVTLCVGLGAGAVAVLVLGVVSACGLGFGCRRCSCIGTWIVLLVALGLGAGL